MKVTLNCLTNNLKLKVHTKTLVSLVILGSYLYPNVEFLFIASGISSTKIMRLIESNLQ